MINLIQKYYDWRIARINRKIEDLTTEYSRILNIVKADRLSLFTGFWVGKSQKIIDKLPRLVAKRDRLKYRL